MLFLLGCTPIAAVGHRDAGAAGNGTHKLDAATQRPDSDGGVAVPEDVASPLPGETCTEANARACAKNEVRAPLSCEDSHWTRQPPCAEDERCQTEAGVQQGQCVAIARECVARRSGVEFCDDKDDKIVRVCRAFVPQPLRSCGAQERCMIVDDRASCVCVFGSVPSANGCQVGTDCSAAQGGCDPLTTCSMNGSERVCSACPANFTGDGKRGCVPLLKALRVSGGELTPGFNPDITSYRLKIPLLHDRVTFNVEAPSGTQLDVNGAKLSESSSWTSPALPLGMRRVDIVLTSRSGVTNRYELNLERVGVQEAFIKASRPDDEDVFGYGLAMDADTLLVGACYEDSGSSGVNGDQADNSAADSGAAYVFARQGGSWVQQAYLKSDMPASNDFFGVNVAVSGDTAAVSATRASPYGNINSSRNGIVYVFVRKAGSWALQSKLSAPNPNGADLFGFGLALQEDRLVVGAPFEGTGARQSGAVYVFTRSGDSWGTPTKLKASTPLSEGFLGWSVAIDGDTIVAGAHHDSQVIGVSGGAGSAYVFVRRDTGWLEQQRLDASSPSSGDLFGWSVAVRGDAIAIGAPGGDLSAAPVMVSGHAYLFERSGEQWTLASNLQAPQRRAADFFGTSVALGDASLVIGAAGDASGATGIGADPMRSDAPQSGALYVYGREQAAWLQSAFVKAAVIDRDDLFGKRVVVSGDIIATAALQEASAAMGVNGDASGNGLPRSGAVYVFR